MPIQVLPQNLINQIAAGEVVVNMASVVKELVENSIDAGARHIRIDLSNDMRDVVVVDDGCGMSPDDAELCLQRHATSKIRTQEDLALLATRGFRGEAVPSIASVSRMEIQTRPEKDLAGTRVVVEGGRIDRIEGYGCAVGTRIEIRDLFFNTPGRRKFIKSGISEMNAVVKTVVRQALATPNVGFRLAREGEVRLDLPPDQPLDERFAAILGNKVESEMLAVDYYRDGVRVTGMLVQPNDSQGDRRSQYMFVNGRPFSSKSIGAAIEQACRGFLMKGRFPKFCLFITVPSDTVDVNVHPTKEEVRFQNERHIAGTCFHAVREVLEDNPHVPEWELDGEAPPHDSAQINSAQSATPSPQSPASHFAPSPAERLEQAWQRKQEERRRVQQDLVGLYLDQPSISERTQPTADHSATPTERAPILERIAATTESRLRSVAAAPGEKPEPEFWNKPFEPEALGQIALTYLVVRFGEDILIIDQHAAHERIRYLELRERLRAPESQALLVPQTLDVGAPARAIMEALIPALGEFGFEVEPFGGSTFVVNAVPADLANLDAAKLLREVVEDSAEEGRNLSAVENVRDKMLIRAACHGSIRAGDRLQPAEIHELLRLMRVHRLSFTCPHGRPTIVRLSKQQLDRQFGRLGA